MYLYLFLWIVGATHQGRHKMMDCMRVCLDIIYKYLDGSPLHIQIIRREWMGVEPTAARNATHHRF